MKWTNFFIPTSKETPADAVVPSHQLMVRAGLIRQVVAGAYSYLPLGYRSLRKVEAIVREEINAAGGIELHLPAMSPIEWWEQTGRVEAMGDVLIRLGDGKGDDWRSRTVLGPTHEEIVTEIARAFINSYKQLPITLYQILDLDSRFMVQRLVHEQLYQMKINAHCWFVRRGRRLGVSYSRLTCPGARKG